MFPDKNSRKSPIPFEADALFGIHVICGLPSLTPYSCVYKNFRLTINIVQTVQHRKLASALLLDLMQATIYTKTNNTLWIHPSYYVMILKKHWRQRQFPNLFFLFNLDLQKIEPDYILILFHKSVRFSSLINISENQMGSPDKILTQRALNARRWMKK